MLNLIKFNSRTWFLIGFLGCAGLIAMAYYFQFVEKLEPCPLCISQRIGIFMTGLCFLLAFLHNPGRVGTRRYAILGSVIALCGGSVSVRHIWIQHLPPDKVPECGPGLDYVLQNFPLADTIKLMLSGTGDCAKVDWTLFGMSMPSWTLIAFLMLATLSLLQFWNYENK
ncbi:MAG: disulfide bond formation protein B [Methyloglobulus sp.]|nr:disulfide bond formation protein B [Methyloglobulus sp.]